MATGTLDAIDSRVNELRRDLRLVDAVGVGLGAIIGAGIFVVTGVAAGVAGPAFLLGLLIAGVAATCNALSAAELAATYPQAGGTYEYGYRVLHPAFGFSAGWMFVASKLMVGGTVALGFSGYVSHLCPSVPPRWGAVCAAALLTLANLFGVKKAGRLNTLIVAVTLLALLDFVLAGLPSFDAAHLYLFAPTGWRGVAEAAALLFFPYMGYARIATLGEEVSEPARTIPRAVMLTVAISVSVYLAVATVAVGAIGAPALYYSIMNLAALRLDPARKLYPKWVAWVGLVSCLLLAGSLRLTSQSPLTLHFMTTMLGLARLNICAT